MDARIEHIQRECAAVRSVLPLAGGLPAEELFPREELAFAFERSLRTTPCGALQYGWPEGSEGLRRWIAARLARRGARISPDDVVVTAGAQQAIAIACELLGTDGKRVGVDEQTYPGALDLLKARGATPASDGEWVYLVDGVDMPAGRAPLEARRRALVDSGKMIVADEAYAELRFDGREGPPLLASAPERVLHVGTFSKTLCPGFRVGWLVTPPSMREAARSAKRDLDLQAGSLAQAIVESYLEASDYDAQLARARRLYERRAQRLVAALAKRIPHARLEAPDGGFSVWLETDIDDVDEAEALAVAAEHGVAFDPGSLFRADGRTSPLAMRLSCSTVGEDRIDEAVGRLARALEAIG